MVDGWNFMAINFSTPLFVYRKLLFYVIINLNKNLLHEKIIY